MDVFGQQAVLLFTLVKGFFGFDADKDFFF